MHRRSWEGAQEVLVGDAQEVLVRWVHFPSPPGLLLCRMALPCGWRPAQIPAVLVLADHMLDAGCWMLLSMAHVFLLMAVHMQEVAGFRWPDLHFMTTTTPLPSAASSWPTVQRRIRGLQPQQLRPSGVGLSSALAPLGQEAGAGGHTWRQPLWLRRGESREDHTSCGLICYCFPDTGFLACLESMLPLLAHNSIPTCFLLVFDHSISEV